MTPAARLSAAAEVLDRIATSRAPAEGVLQAWGRANRYAGSGDRRAIAERVFACLRARGQLAAGGGAEDGRTLVLFSLRLLDGLSIEQIEVLHSGAGYAPAPLSAAERARLEAAEGQPGRVPAFVEADFRARFGEAWAAEAEALIGGRAPLDLRVNGGSREAVANELRRAGLSVEATPWSAWGLRLPGGSEVQTTAAWREGRVEVQDEGSQLAAWLAGARPGERVVDYCAGGGGKTLALAQALGGQGELVACDVEPRRLEAIRPRLVRAGATAELRALGAEGEGTTDLEGRADRVFVDAPCSGAGTWRRRPEAAWRLTAEEVERLHGLQVRILEWAARLVRPGGRLVYVTCSVLGRENEDSAAAFAGRHAEFRALPIVEAVSGGAGLTQAGQARLVELSGGGNAVQLTPHRTGMDGFYVALWERAA